MKLREHSSHGSKYRQKVGRQAEQKSVNWLHKLYITLRFTANDHMYATTPRYTSSLFFLCPLL
jgi:hypothetical protein